MNNRYPARVRIRKPLLLHSLAGRLGTSFFPSLSFSFPICIFLFFIFIFLKIFYLFLERGEGREKERDRNINVWLPLTCHLLGTWPTTQACALTGNQTRDLLVHRSALNPLNHTSRGCFIKKSFINYAITIIPFFPPLFLSALHSFSHQQSLSLFSSCPWVIHISSLASLFPILFFTSPYFVFTIYASYFLYLFPHYPTSPSLLITLHVISISVILFLF